MTARWILLNWSLLLTLVLAVSSALNTDRRTTYIDEFFTYKIEPTLFNCSEHELNKKFHFRAALHGKPDLPSWLRYGYSKEYQFAALYGRPPEYLAGTKLKFDLVATNLENYSTYIAHIYVLIGHKFPTPNTIQMKIDNLNWVHLMDPGRVENLRNIFTKDLWPDSAKDLRMTFMESVPLHGGRMPLLPQEAEGVIVHLGSRAQFSPRLNNLQEEVRPLYKLTSCTYKRTSVQKIFENAGFKLDWCAFKMVGNEAVTEVLYQNQYAKDHLSAAETNSTKLNQGTLNYLKNQQRWIGMPRDEVPERNYIDELAFALCIPLAVFFLLLGGVSVILCFDTHSLYDPHSEFFFQNIFHICEESCEKPDADSVSESVAGQRGDFILPVRTSSKTQILPHNDSDQQITTLKSLKDPNGLLDGFSLRSHSPNNNYYSLDSPTNAYLRPKPPPYKSNTLGRNGVDI